MLGEKGGKLMKNLNDILWDRESVEDMLSDNSDSNGESLLYRPEPPLLLRACRGGDGGIEDLPPIARPNPGSACGN